jgi:L-threonylcarbamoyladenylate synthase
LNDQERVLELGLRVRMIEVDEDKIMEIGGIVRRGGVIVYPTETVYGIGGDPFKEDVVRRVFQIKRRRDKEMPVLVSSMEKAMEIAEFDDRALTLARLFWPGPLTLVLKKRSELPHELTAGRDKVGIRVPKHIVALKIIEAAGGAIIGTSANISGRPPPRSADELDPVIENEVDLVVDGGRTELGVASTVVELVPGGEGHGGGIKVIREGAIKAESLIEAVRGVGL